MTAAVSPPSHLVIFESFWIVPQAADPASHGFLSAWTEKDPCSLITSMANQFYPQSS